MSYILALCLAIVSVVQFWLMRDRDAPRAKKTARRAGKAGQATTLNPTEGVTK